MSEPITSESFFPVDNLLNPTSVLYSFLLDRNFFIRGSTLYIVELSIAKNSYLCSNSEFFPPINLKSLIALFKSKS